MNKIFLIIIITIILFLIFITYIYTSPKSKLLDSGYSKDEINYIIKNFSKEEIDNLLLNNYKKNQLYNIQNLKRYISYKEKNKAYSIDNIVTYVEIGLDKEFYTNIKEINYCNKLCLVNKYNKLPNNYNAPNLITLTKEYSSNSQKLNKEASYAIISMINDAKKANINLNVISGYRTENYQTSLFTNSTNKNGINHALLYSARPGHSEHQTGYAADFNITEESFSNTKEYKWLKENAFKYGFIERYPKDKVFITGYAYEPWHYRYVGIEASTIIYKEHITFEEYYVKYIK